MASLKEMMEIILHKEIGILFEKASGPLGLTFEETRKLEIYSKIVENVTDDSNDFLKKRDKGEQVNIKDLVAALRKKVDVQEE